MLLLVPFFQAEEYLCTGYPLSEEKSYICKLVMFCLKTFELHDFHQFKKNTICLRKK